MAKITSGVACSHVPALGVASDKGITEDDYYGPIFKGFEFSKKWMAEEKPDVIFLVYNDHCTAFDARVIPTFALGCASRRLRSAAVRETLGSGPGLMPAGSKGASSLAAVRRL